jgi:hypothetical protein
MINVGREFELDKSQWRSTVPIILGQGLQLLLLLLVAVYYMWLMPDGMFWDWESWKAIYY